MLSEVFSIAFTRNFLAGSLSFCHMQAGPYSLNQLFRPPQCMVCHHSYCPKTFVLILTLNFVVFGRGTSPTKLGICHYYHGKKTCRPKHVGGIGIRLMRDSNFALLSKMAWMMSISSSRPWFQCLQAKYLCHMDFFNAVPKPSSSWFWKGLLKTRPLISRG